MWDFNAGEGIRLKGILSKIRFLAALALALMWLGLVICSICSFWRSGRIAIESFDPNVLHGFTDARFFTSYSLLSSHGGLGLAIHAEIIFTKRIGRHFIWENSVHPEYPHFAVTKILGGYSSGRPFRQSGSVYSTNLFPESITESYPPSTGEWSMQYSGFHASVTGDAGVDRAWVIVVPWWSLIIASGLIAVFPMRQKIRMWRIRHRMQSGKCSVCGYDLRATPDRCPECGTIPEAAKGAAP
jgi:hypothetical protein